LDSTYNLTKIILNFYNLRKITYSISSIFKFRSDWNFLNKIVLVLNPGNQYYMEDVGTIQGQFRDFRPISFMKPLKIAQIFVPAFPGQDSLCGGFGGLISDYPGLGVCTLVWDHRFLNIHE